MHVRCLRSSRPAALPLPYPLQLSVRSGRRVRPKKMLIKLLPKYTIVITLMKKVRKKSYIISVASGKEPKLVIKATTGESSVKLSEHVTEDIEEPQPMCKYTHCDYIYMTKNY